MRKKTVLITLLLLCCASLLLAGCSNTIIEPIEQSAVQVSEAPAEASPEPTPSPQPSEVTLSAESTAADIAALADNAELKFVDAADCEEYEALTELRKARPDCEIVWNVEYQNNTYPNTTTSLEVVELEGLEKALRALPELEEVDLMAHDVSVEYVDSLYEIRPDVFYKFRFAFQGWAMNTGIECYSSLRDVDYYRLTDEDVYTLVKYCKHLKALDLGHDDIRDVSYIGQLKELQVLIIADNPNLVDASPLANLENLVYLEFFMNHKTESYEWLNSLTKLVDLNLCYCDNLGDLSFLENMPDIRFGLFKYSGISDEELSKWQHQYPESILVNYDGNRESCESGWRDTRRNAQIRYAFQNWRHVTSYPNYADATFDFNGFVYGWA